MSVLLSLLLSPITAIYAAVIGALGLGVCLIGGRRRTVPAPAFAGITVGSLPYIVTGLVV